MHSASDFRQNPIFRASFHTIVTSRAFWYAPPDTGVPNLILVASEQLPSTEGAVEILMDVPFLRGPCRGGAEPRPYRVHSNGFPYEGKLPPEAADEVGSVT